MTYWNNATMVLKVGVGLVLIVTPGVDGEDLGTLDGDVPGVELRTSGFTAIGCGLRLTLAVRDPLVDHVLAAVGQKPDGLLGGERTDRRTGRALRAASES